MTLDQIIVLFQHIERGSEGEKIGIHLHFGITQAVRLNWFNRFREENDKFSDFLIALKNEEYPAELPVVISVPNEN